MLTGNAKWLHLWHATYRPTQVHLRTSEGWYVESEMSSGSTVYAQFNSLAAFFPGLQTLVGDIGAAAETQAKHYALWQRFDALPERYLLHAHMPHTSEKHYILRPEIMESTYFLYRATKVRFGGARSFVSEALTSYPHFQLFVFSLSSVSLSSSIRNIWRWALACSRV